MMQPRQKRGITPQKPSRLQPTEPLHMTTRRAATKAASNTSGSTAGSVTSDQSRRNSLADERPVSRIGSKELHSPGSRRMSQGSATTPSNPSQDSQASSVSRRSARSISKPLPSIVELPSPSRKRKRTDSSTNDEAPNGITALAAIANGENATMTPPMEDLLMPDAMNTNEIEEDVPRPLQIVTTAASTDVTPMGSQLVSPEGASSMDEQLDIEPKMAEADEAARFPSGRPKRRLAGRRRAPHADPKIEAALRRQLELKTTYRAVARALKPVLAEIAVRTTNDIKKNAEAHKAAVEYEKIKTGLDRAYEKRREFVNKQFQLYSDALKEKWEAESQLREAQRIRCNRDMRDRLFDQLFEQCVDIQRKAQHDTDPNATDDEDNESSPRPKAASYPYKLGETLDAQYDSRSRQAIKADVHVEDLVMRDKLYEMQKAYDPDSVPDERPSFAVFSASHREMTAKIANNKRKSVQAAKTLAEAAEEVERIAKIPVIKNADALGLQVLADLANRPVIRNFLPPPVAQTWRPEVVQAPTNTIASTPSKAMSGHGTPVKPPSSHGRGTPRKPTALGKPQRQPHTPVLSAAQIPRRRSSVSFLVSPQNSRQPEPASAPITTDDTGDLRTLGSKPAEAQRVVQPLPFVHPERAPLLADVKPDRIREEQEEERPSWPRVPANQKDHSELHRPRSLTDPRQPTNDNHGVDFGRQNYRGSYREPSNATVPSRYDEERSVSPRARQIARPRLYEHTDFRVHDRRNSDSGMHPPPPPPSFGHRDNSRSRSPTSSTISQANWLNSGISRTGRHSQGQSNVRKRPKPPGSEYWTNKEQRGGASRRKSDLPQKKVAELQHKIKREHSHSISGGSPPPVHRRHQSLSNPSLVSNNQQWVPGAQQSPGFPPPPLQYQPGQQYAHSPPPTFSYGQPGQASYDYNQQQQQQINGFRPQYQPPVTYSQPPPSPLYAMPQGSPPGTHPAQWSQPPPPPTFQGMPTLAPHPPPPPPAGLGQQYGGQPILPAPQHYSQGPAPFPAAFAQEKERRRSGYNGASPWQQWRGPGT